MFWSFFRKSFRSLHGALAKEVLPATIPAKFLLSDDDRSLNSSVSYAKADHTANAGLLALGCRVRNS
jgi:hypothetical protein